ncbi:biliverdin-producing heme oxygenase [Sphingomonas sp. PL-96]|uniref:biliverdin-producing heme oxygenase n=1 Tax=Sphingomonas sp. PL-96 TaxID=2887201 RepID=UPI001E3EB6B6|nr:biliverdin-producing heme oxygenase [Sphingomonas sp. PL-96]MCC2977536.1 biliverdin-producing heme oxygenase [Sphingomonas sp. PL-96]
MLASATLRETTRAAHDRVDAAFARFDLQSRDRYAAMLVAHARALPAAEAAMAAEPSLPAWSPRTPLLEADLHDLGWALPPRLPLALPPGAAALAGLTYVIEGSRLGGVYLARQVGTGLPARYLSAAHGKGDWRALLAWLDRAGENGGNAWITQALAGAAAGFTLFQQAAEAA